MVPSVSVNGDPEYLWFGLTCNMLLRQHVNDKQQNWFCTIGFSVSGNVVSNTSLDFKSAVIVKHRELKCLSGLQTKFSSDCLSRKTTSEDVCLLILRFY